MKRPEQSRIDKLPVWAQEWMQHLERREKSAIDALDAVRLSAEESQIYIRQNAPSNTNPDEFYWWHPIQTRMVMFNLKGLEVECSVSHERDGNYPGQSVIVRSTHGTLRVAPLVSNSIEVYVEP